MSRDGAWASIGGVDVRVSHDPSHSARRDVPVAHHQGRAVSGAMRESRNGFKGEWDLTVSHESRGVLDALRRVLQSTPPIDCEGIVFGDSPTFSPTHTRADTATYRDSQGVLQTAASGTLRDNHWVQDENGLWVPSLLLEASRTNHVTESEDVSSWTKSEAGWSLDANIATAPDGAATGGRITSDGNTGHARIAGSSVTSGNQSPVSMFVLKNNTTWCWVGEQADSVWHRVWVNLDTGATGTEENIDHVHVETHESGGNTWYRVEIVYTASSNFTSAVAVSPATADGAVTSNNNDAVHAWGAQQEGDGFGFVTSYIPTSGGTDTRTADSLYFDLTPAPQSLSLYLKFRELGTAQAANNLGLLHIGAASGGADPRLDIYNPSGNYRVQYDDGSTVVEATLSAGPSFGDIVELVVTVDTDGSVTITQSINGGTATSASDATTATLPDSWAGTRLYLNSSGSSAVGAAAFITAPVIAKGVQTMGTMRNLRTPDLFPSQPIGKVSCFVTEHGEIRPMQVGDGQRWGMSIKLAES